MLSCLEHFSTADLNLNSTLTTLRSKRQARYCQQSRATACSEHSRECKREACLAKLSLISRCSASPSLFASFPSSIHLLLVLKGLLVLALARKAKEAQKPSPLVQPCMQNIAWQAYFCIEAVQRVQTALQTAYNGFGTLRTHRQASAEPCHGNSVGTGKYTGTARVTFPC